MGVFYIVVPVDDQVRGYLEEIGLACPGPDVRSRNPTPKELRVSVGVLDGIDAEFWEGSKGELSQIMLSSEVPDSGPWTLMNVNDWCGEQAPCSFSFEKGWPELILAAVVEISRHTGPLVVFPDTGCNPLVVEANSNVAELMRDWDHTREYVPGL